MLQRCLLFAATAIQVSTLSLDVSDHQSIVEVAASIVRGTLSAFPPSGEGLFPFPPYYWWESGGVWGGMIDYRSYTGDDTYLDMTLSALAAQTGPNFDYIPPAQADNEANDDQAFWAFAVLDALEQGLPPLPCAGDPCSNSYLAMAKNVFNEFVQRYNKDSSTCGGGMLWQYNPSLNGYDYKNTVSNGGFFNVAARLARYTGDSQYADWAEKIWDWETSVGLISSQNNVFDGTHIEDGCKSLDKTQWTYNNAIHMHGAAMMYAIDEDDTWRTRVQGLLNAGTDTFFSPFSNSTNVLFEAECERGLKCTTDQLSFKAYLARFWAKTTVLAPFTADQIHPLIEASAKGAASSCNAGGVCGQAWWYGGYDGSSDLGQQLSALEIVQALLIGQAPAPRKAAGGSAPSSPSAEPAANPTSVVPDSDTSAAPASTNSATAGASDAAGTGSPSTTGAASTALVGAGPSPTIASSAAGAGSAMSMATSAVSMATSAMSMAASATSIAASSGTDPAAGDASPSAMGTTATGTVDSGAVHHIVYSWVMVACVALHAVVLLPR